jgi:hypothetical protein
MFISLSKRSLEQQVFSTPVIGVFVYHECTMRRGRLITPTVITPTVITPTVISPTLITPTVITPTLINTPTMHPGLYHHILSNRNSKQL